MQKIIKLISKHWPEIALFLFSFSVLLFFKKSFIQLDWDGFEYIRKIYLHQKSDLFLGRIGYIYFFIPIWDIFKYLFHLSILDFHHVIRFFNIIFGSLTIALIYLTLKRIFRDWPIALGMALILLFSPEFIISIGEIRTEIPVFFFVFASYFSYVMAFEKKNRACLYLSAFLFGYAFEVRESALFMIFFFPAYFISVKGWKTFWLKEAILFAAIMLFTAIIGPIFFVITEGSKYLDKIKYWLSVGSYVDLTAPLKYPYIIYSIINCGFRLQVLSFLGLLTLFMGKEKNNLLVIVSLILPALIGLCTLGNATPTPRFFMICYPAFALLASIFIDFISDVFSSLLKTKQSKGVIYLVLLICFLLISFPHLSRYMKWDKEESKRLETYGLYLLNNFPENTVFLIGQNSSVMGNYFIPLTNSIKEVIWSVWEWPGKDLGKVAKIYLLLDNIIVIDPSQFQFPNEKKDVEELMKEYRTSIFKIPGPYDLYMIKK